MPTYANEPCVFSWLPTRVSRPLPFLLLAAFLLGAFTTASAQSRQQDKQALLPVNYLLYQPKAYGQDKGKKWPLLIFLHGSGERGSDLAKVKVHGPPKLVEAGQDFPFIIVSPQCPADTRWSTDLLDGMLDQILRENRVDTTRIYLTGLSMGGFGTWDWAIASPKRFAAIVPICGGGKPEDVWAIRKMPTWVFHGAKDQAVPLQKSQDMVDALKKTGNPVQFTVYPEADHDSWTETYNNPALFEWLLKQQKQPRKIVKVTPKVLDAYVGEFKMEPNFVITFTKENDKLFAQPQGQPKFELLPMSDTEFFVREFEAELGFLKNAKGKVDEVILHQNGSHIAKRIK